MPRFAHATTEGGPAAAGRRPRRSALGLASGALVFFLLGASPAHPQALAYVESSEGLDVPELDGGYTEVEMGDVNADGRLDLVSIGDHGSPFINTDQHGVMVWFGDGQGSWSLAQFGIFGYGGVALGDVNGDGRMDVGYGMHHNYSGEDLGDQLIEVALGDGTGLSWTPWDDGLATAGETYGMFGTDFADVDADGDLDLASISFGCCNGVRVYLNQGDGTWTDSLRSGSGNSRQEIAFGDVNGDGWPDFAASFSGGTVWVGDGSGAFTPFDGALPGPSWRKGVALGDADGDGADELAWVNNDGGPEVFRLGAGDAWADFGASLPPSGPWQAAQLWDMDADGIVDLAAFGNRTFALWKGDGAGGWTPIASFRTPSPGNYAAFRVGGDADRNGYPDIVLVADEGGFFSRRNMLRFFRESSVPTELAVRLVKPSANAALRAGAARFIEWASAVPGGADSRVALAYSVDGGPWTPIAIGVPDNGRHQWTVPEVPGSALRLAIAVAAAGGGRAFAIGPSLRLLSSD